MKKLLLLVLLLTSTTAWSADEDGHWSSNSTPSCSDYVAEPSKSNGFAIAGWWIAGYISAYNRLTPNTYDILGDVDFKGVYLWMEDWCKANPLERIGTGMKVLTAELYPRRHKTKKEAGR